MQSLWNDQEAQALGGDPLKLRVHTSRLIGRDPDLVLHGGGNTSVKATTKDFFGESQDILYVKGSGWDLISIEAEGFAPVKLDTLIRMAALDHLTDTEMVRLQRAAMLNPEAPNPSVEAILHAIIPFKFVDHTHADAVVTVSNTPQGEENIRAIYGDRVLIVPYVMPGFILAKKVYEMTQGLDWSQLEGMILMNHGIFTFADDAKLSYERMIKLVDEAEQFIKEKKAWDLSCAKASSEDLLTLARLRQQISNKAGFPMVSRLDASPEAVGFSNLPNVSDLATRGPLTPDHVIRTKRVPLVGQRDSFDVDSYQKNYQKYFQEHADEKLTCLDPAPRWAVWPGQGVVGFGKNVKDAQIVYDINQHTIRCIQWAQTLGGWKALPAKDIFEVEYWELEQAKLKKSKSSLPFQGKVVLVTGAASGIGRACAQAFHNQGAAVVALDLNPQVEDLFADPQSLGIACDVTEAQAVEQALEKAVRHFGGLDILVSNAGLFPASQTLDKMDDQTWDRSMELNLSSHQRLLKACLPYLSLGLDPAVVIMGSKNVPAPGPGASAYSVAKAGLNQLARVAALELAPKGIRVNVLHPNAVFDTGIWTEEVLKSRAASYGLSVENYKKNNLLGVEVSSSDVAQLACAMAGPLFSKTTGAQIPVDGGNERVI